MDYNASDTRHLRRAAKAARIELDERRGVILNLMSNPSGRAYIYSILMRCHIFSSSFSATALAMAFAEGERNIGLQILTDVMAFAPDQYVQMMREQNDKEQSDGRRDDDRSGRSGSDNGRDDSGRADDAVGSVDREYDPIAELDDA